MFEKLRCFMRRFLWEDKCYVLMLHNTVADPWVCNGLGLEKCIDCKYYKNTDGNSNV